MINKDFGQIIVQNCVFSVTQGQHKVVSMLADFYLSREQDAVCMWHGYAGTGKTSVIAAFVKSLLALHQKVVLMAPTGRAAKVLSLAAGLPASTIHKRIYRQARFNGENDNFRLNVNLAKHTLFIVDEASMISGENNRWGEGFSSTSLLDDLISFVYSGEGCRLMLVGDVAQLPPVGEEMSVALQADALRARGLTVYTDELVEVVRQREESGILYNATALRMIIASDECYELPRLHLKMFADIKRLGGSELIDALEQAYARDGYDDTIVITRSNKTANTYNKGIRARILYNDEELCGGDRVLIAKNHYLTADEVKQAPFDYIANGEVAVVRRCRNVRSFYGFSFADVTLQFADYDDYEMETTVLLDVLQSESPALTVEQSKMLWSRVEEDYADITVKRDRVKKIKTDPYFNALQIKYAYALTCHKAQGGQWKHVFIDQGYITPDTFTPDYCRWLYTALTRATSRVYLVNWPKEQIAEE